LLLKRFGHAGEPVPPKGVGIADPLSGTAKRRFPPSG
jgi:hypothetical protein